MKRNRVHIQLPVRLPAQLPLRPSVALTGLLLGLLSACSSPPKPPTVDESRKRPVNDEMAVALQVCQIDLNNTRLQVVESQRQTSLANVTLAQMTVRHRLLASLHQRTDLFANQVHTVRFAHASTQVDIPADEHAVLLVQAQAAALVLLKGRTDGQRDSLTESRLARARAEAVRDLLVDGGVDPRRIRTTYQPVGDTVAENETPHGRALNRRVEIELYRTAPLVMQGTSVAQTPDALPPDRTAR
jgi:outer membrane protein OmpA-like peptidoglycan-associated protein